MRKTGVLIVAMFLTCPAFAANESREQKRLEACGQVFKEIMDIPDGIPKDLPNKAECEHFTSSSYLYQYWLLPRTRQLAVCAPLTKNNSSSGK
jgi:hypothetical protein